jgi:hypothetical protein
MDSKKILEIIDNRVFSHTGKRLDKIQLGILESAFNGQKYAKLAEKYERTEGHIRDKGYELWRLLSDVLGKEVNKANLKSAIEKLIISTGDNNFINSGTIDNLKFCPNSSTKIEENEDVINDDQILIESAQKKIKRETIPRLVKLGLNAEQIAEALDLSIQEVRKIIS